MQLKEVIGPALILNYLRKANARQLNDFLNKEEITNSKKGLIMTLFYLIGNRFLRMNKMQYQEARY